MAVVREDVVKVTYEVDDKPLQQVDDSIDELVSNTQKMAGDSGVGGLTKGFESLANAAKQFANTKIDAVKTKLQETKEKLTEGEKGAKGLYNAVKNIAKAGFSKVISGVQKLTTGLGKALVAAGKLAAKMAGLTLKGLAVGVGAAATGLVALGTAAIKAYSDFEQLEGGVKTLFGDDVANTVITNANNAFNTAGLSANEYLDTVTSFSASLIQSVGGDTARAAELADVAIRDMSDNANKMGTDMGSLQTTYAGFAKQNYTMLDNLKLGYGGTKEEMQRLLNDASKLPNALGKKFDISNYADIVEAIHLVQENMGIAGATADEAATTIEGSFKSMKGAWTNFVAGLANKDADLGQLTDNLVTSVETFGKNVIPAVQIMLPRLVTGLSSLAQSVASALPGILDSLLPAIADGAIELVDALVTTLQDNTSMLADTAMTVVMKLAEFFLQSAPKILVVGIELITKLATGLAQQMPTLIPLAIQAIFTIFNSLMQNLPTILQAGIQVLLALVNGITQMLPQLIPMGVSAILQFMMGIINNLPAILQAGVQLIVALAQGIAQSLPQLIQAIPEMFAGVVEAILSINWLQVGWDIVKAIGGGLWDGIAGLFTDAESAGKAAGKGVASGINHSTGEAVTATADLTSQIESLAITDMTSLVDTTGDTLTALPEAFSTNFGDALDVTKSSMSNTKKVTQAGMRAIKSTVDSTNLYSSGVAVMQGLNNGMQSMVPTLLATARSIASSIKNTINSALDIHSPSRVTEESGMYAGMGLIKGLRNTVPEIEVASREVSNATIPYDTYSPESSSTYHSGDSHTYATISPQFNLTISGSQDDRAMARRVKRYVAEAIQDTFESLERKSYSLREV